MALTVRENCVIDISVVSDSVNNTYSGVMGQLFIDTFQSNNNRKVTNRKNKTIA